MPVQVLSKWQEVLVASAAAAAATGKRLSVNWMKVKRLSGSALSGNWHHVTKLEVSSADMVQLVTVSCAQPTGPCRH